MNKMTKLIQLLNGGAGIATSSQYASLQAKLLGATRQDTELNDADFTITTPTYRALFKITSSLITPPQFLQCKPPWSNKLYSPTGSLTFCKAGCLVCSTAAQAAHANYNVNPATFARAIADQGAFQGNYLQHPTAITRAFPRLLWHKANAPTFWSPRYKRKESSFINWREQPADLELLQTLLNKQPVVLEVDYDPQDNDVDQHFVLAYQYIPDPSGGLNDDLRVMDPMAGHTSILSYFNPHWLNNWMRRNEITKVMRTITGARVWEIVG
jgi:hypothetical protein